MFAGRIKTPQNLTGSQVTDTDYFDYSVSLFLLTNEMIASEVEIGTFGWKWMSLALSVLVQEKPNLNLLVVRDLQDAS